MEHTSHTDVLFLSRDEVDSLLNYSEVREAVEKAFRSDADGQLQVLRKAFFETGKDCQLFPMSGCIRDLDLAGVKWTNFYPNMPSGIPTCWSHVLVLSHLSDGQPYAILDATGVTSYRTAGGHAAVAAKYLANPDSRVLSVVGCGAQGLSAIRSFREIFPLEKIKILTGERSKARCKPILEKEMDIPVEFVSGGEKLCQDCDILVTASTADSPLVWSDMIPAGCFIAAVYSFFDLDPAISHNADKWIIGQWDADREDILEDPALRGKLNEADIYGTLGEIISGKKAGRQNKNEIIVFSHMGMACLDIAVADKLVEKAKQNHCGTLLHLN